jgi:hypothetical protein
LGRLTRLWPLQANEHGVLARRSAAMRHAKQASKKTRRRKSLPVLGAAGLSLSLASGASAAVLDLSANLPAPTASVSQQMSLHDEEISDVSLATFHVFDKENKQRLRARLAMGGGGGGCGCCFACACGSSNNPPAYGGIEHAPPPVRPTNKYRRSPKRS